MCAHATNSSARARRSGSALLGALVLFVGLLGVVLATVADAVRETRESRLAFECVRARQLAEAGAQRALNFLAQASQNADFLDPLGALQGLFSAQTTIAPFEAEPMLEGAAILGTYSVRLSALQQSSNSITIAIDSTGYPPRELASAGGQALRVWHAQRTTVRYTLAPSQVFDYAYFINNWGWYYGSTILCYGNARSNGQFDVAGYAPTVTGQPLYDGVDWNGSQADLSGYRDDNQDDLQDGGDGGVFAGWDIVGAQKLKGNGGKSSNQHEFEDAIEMPNLSDLGRYEKSALAQGGSISVDGVKLVDGVWGDGKTEAQNLYLVGTPAKPIVIHGPVVVRGNLVISGTVTGQGAIYAGGNVYCPNSVSYANPPATPVPADNTQATTEAWLSANWKKDFLGLLARKNVVIGDCTDSTWKTYVSSWMADPMNESAEDAGLDGVPNTLVGKDGKAGTADDDVLEGDGVFTVEHYSEQDEKLGLIPPGKVVGDAIPGTGEDIDGDGQFTPKTKLSDVLISLPLTSAAWGGNLPSGGVTSYNAIASTSANQLDGVFYTNHSFCWTVLGKQSARINGALVTRNEDIIYGTPTLEFNYDRRLLGGVSGLAANLLPNTLQPALILRRAALDTDPNHAGVAP